MKRELSSFENQEFDLVIVGAGVYGAATAWDAALRGLSVALVDKGDFGGATSFNNLKTVHGGLRYLQHADLRRMRESVRERRTLMRIAPHLVHPLPFLLPTYREGVRRRSILAAALFLNDVVSFDRNRNLDAGKCLPPGRTISRAECQRLVPGVEERGLTGAALWYDAQISNSDRLTLSFVLSADDAGARVANYVEATGFLRDGNRVRGITAKDLIGQAEFEIKGRAVLNAAGPWVDRMLDGLEGTSRPRFFYFSKAMNLVTRPIVKDVAVGVTSKRNQILFVIPWRGLSMIGTKHAVYDGDPDEFEAREEDIQELLDEVNSGYPPAKLRREDVRLVHRGLLPMVPADNKDNKDNNNGVAPVKLVKQYRIHDHRREGLEGLVSMVGVKYTTARDVAEKAVTRVFHVLGKKPPPSRTANTPVYGGAIESLSDFLGQETKRTPHGLDEEVVRHLVYTYGSAYRKILAYIDEDPACAQPVKEGAPVLRAEVIHAIREEQATDLASVLLRRTELGSAGHPGDECLRSCATIMAGELNWDDSRTSSEIKQVEEIYRSRS
jgi:glycerol-3-phosphate dehydrogenase